LGEIQCVRSTLTQSVKAVLAAACQTVAFTDVLDVLCHVQVCIMDAIQESGLGGCIQGLKTVSTEQWLGAIRQSQKKVSIRGTLKALYNSLVLIIDGTSGAISTMLVMVRIPVYITVNPTLCC
uniref:Polyprotein n=1 Tax=Echinostoma caproni TaxID=27848 RepID=A0A183A0H5_9TREM